MKKRSQWFEGLIWAETMHEQGRGGEAYQHSVLGRDMDGPNDFDRGIQDYFKYLESQGNLS